jgi:hypothetical protein
MKNSLEEQSTLGVRPKARACSRITTFWHRQNQIYHSTNKKALPIRENSSSHPIDSLFSGEWSGYYTIITIEILKMRPKNNSSSAVQNSSYRTHFHFLHFHHQRFPPARNCNRGDGDGFLLCSFFLTNSNSTSPCFFLPSMATRTGCLRSLISRV